MSTPNRNAEIEECIKTFIREYQASPMNYFYEEDIRSELIVKLRKGIDYYITLPENEWTKNYEPAKRKVSGFRAEYPSRYQKDYKELHGATAFDIAILDDNPKIKNHYLLPIVGAIELKLSWNDSNNSAFKLDMSKLHIVKNYKSLSLKIAICFEQNLNYNTDMLIKDYKDSVELRNIELEKIEFKEDIVNVLIVTPKELLYGLK